MAEGISQPIFRDEVDHLRQRHLAAADYEQRDSKRSNLLSHEGWVRGLGRGGWGLDRRFSGVGFRRQGLWFGPVGPAILDDFIAGPNGVEISGQQK